MSALPIMIGVLCILAIAYRYYSAFLAAKVMVLDDIAPDSRAYDERRAELLSNQQVGVVRPSLRRDLGRRPAGGTRARRAIRIPARACCGW